MDTQEKPGKIRQVIMKNIKGFFPLTNSASSRRSSDQQLRHLPTSNTNGDAKEEDAPIDAAPGGWKTMPYIIGTLVFLYFFFFFFFFTLL